MAGYIRQSTFVDGDTITAALFNNEYNQLVNAFSNTSGHKHDGTTAEGPVIGLIGDAGETSPNNKVLIDTVNNYIEFYVEVSSAPVQQLYIADGAIIPVTDSDIDLGTTSLRFKDTYTDTVTTTGNVSIGGDLTVTGSATISGNLTFGDADTDSINLAAEIDSDIIPNTDGTYDLGSSTKEWQDLYIDGIANIDSLVADTADINGGTIDGATIATSDITVGAGKTLNVSAGTLTLADNQISGDKVEGGTIAATTITTLTSTTGNITNVNATTLDTTNIEVTNLKAKDGTAAGSIADSTGVVTLASSVLTTTDINGGTIDGVTIGGTTAGAVTFTDLSDGTITIAGFADEDNMVSNSATLLPTQQSVKAYVDSQVTAQDLDFQGDTGGALSIDLDSESLTIAGGTGIDTVGASNTLTVAIDSTVATLTGTQTLTNKTLTTPIISSISNTGTLTLPTSTDTLIGRATTDTLTNKTLTTPIISSISNTGTLTLPTSTDTLVGRATTDTLTNKTLTSPVINTSVSGTAFLDDDTFATASATTLASSESIKAYVDTTVAATNEVVEDTTPQLGGDLDLNSSDITGTGNINITGTIQSSGNITGTLATAAQPNITSVGTLTGFTSTGIDDNATSTAITIDSSEIVSIGHTSAVNDANAPLQLNAPSGGQKFMMVNANGSYGLMLGYDMANSTARIRNIQNTPLTFETNNTERMRIDASGNVGIGTTSIGGSSTNRQITSVGSAASQLTLTGGGSFSTNVGTNGTVGYLEVTGANNLALYTNSAERMRIDNSGNVGIGTSSPSDELTVRGSQFNTTTVSIGDNSDRLRLGYLHASGLTSSTSAGQIGTTASSQLDLAAPSNAASTMRFFTNASSGAPSERMRIDGSGHVMFGTTTVTPATTSVTGVSALSDGRLHVSAQSQTSLFVNRMGTDGTVVEFRNDATIVGSVSFSGATTSYNTSSDARLKDITGEARGLEVINELNPVAYNWKADGKADEGLIAQEVLDVVPNAVSQNEENQMYQMDYSKLVVHLVKGMKEQQAQIEALQSEINLLKGE